MYINNIDINIYGASVSKKIIKRSDIFIEKEKNGINITKISNKVGFAKMHLKILFEGENRDVINSNISNFIKNLIDEADIKFKNMKNTFNCYLNSSDIDDTEFDEWIYLNLELDCYEYGEEIIETINRVTNKTINVGGNIETPCIVEITPSIDIIDLTLEGLADDPIIIKNLKAGKKVIVDGELQTVTQEGINKYGDTDMWDFPSLKPGANTVKVSKNSCDITLKYKPRFI